MDRRLPRLPPRDSPSAGRDRGGCATTTGSALNAELLDLSEGFRDCTKRLTRCHGKATHALNPLTYAWDAHRTYLERYARPRIEAVWIGMNPGPWGMMQTGVPFGAVPSVRDYLGIECEVKSPLNTHPKRPVQGFACPRVEVSGTRLWGAIEASMGSPDHFFERYWIVNYCPLVWQVESGANLPPDKLPAAETAKLFEACDAHLAAVTRLLRPRTLIGVGVWAEARARRVVKSFDLPVDTGRLLHPSPASPAANRGWAPAAKAQLEALGHPLAPV